MTKIELKVVEWFLDAPWGSPEMHETLDELIEMTAVNRAAWDAKDLARLKRKEGFQ